MAKQWICFVCGEPIHYGEECPHCKYFEIPEEFLTPMQISKLQYEGSIDEYYD